MFDLLIIGGGVAGVSCALILGSANKKLFVQDKKIAIITHQKSSAMQEAVLNNAYGITPGKMGSEILLESLDNLNKLYPHILQIGGEKVLKVEGIHPNFTVVTNKNSFQVKNIVVALGNANTFDIDGLNQFVENHKKSIPEKNRIQLKNTDHKVAHGIYVGGTLAGWASQLSIAAGSGASVATDILTLWNNGIPTHSHDSIR